MIAIREATAKDGERISALSATVQRLHAEALPAIFRPPSAQTWPTETVREVLADANNRVYIAECDGEAAGYIYCEIVQRDESPITYARDRVYVHHISVQARWQKKGVGSALIQVAKDLARENNITELGLDTWAFNDKALAFFQRQGFVINRHILAMQLTDKAQ
jgi:ribosomal protein S18 acetylase RimI-like enzyme